MTRAEKIEALAEELRNVARGGSPEPMWTVVARSVQDRIDAAGVQWTRVEDGLPKPGRKVQLTVEYENGVREVRRTRYLSRDEGWGDVGTYVRPLAWAPLPEPWRV